MRWQPACRATATATSSRWSKTKGLAQLQRPLQPQLAVAVSRQTEALRAGGRPVIQVPGRGESSHLFPVNPQALPSLAHVRRSAARPLRQARGREPGGRRGPAWTSGAWWAGRCAASQGHQVGECREVVSGQRGLVVHVCGCGGKGVGCVASQGCHGGRGRACACVCGVCAGASAWGLS